MIDDNDLVFEKPPEVSPLAGSAALRLVKLWNDTGGHRLPWPSEDEVHEKLTTKGISVLEIQSMTMGDMGRAVAEWERVSKAKSGPHGTWGWGLGYLKNAYLARVNQQAEKDKQAEQRQALSNPLAVKIADSATTEQELAMKWYKTLRPMKQREVLRPCREERHYAKPRAIVEAYRRSK